MNKLITSVVLLLALAATGAAVAAAREPRSALTSRYLRFRVSNGMNDRTNVIPEYKFAARFIGRVGLSNGSSVGPTPPLRARGASWQDFLRLEVWHDGERAESWLELSFDIDTSYSGLAIPQEIDDVRKWQKTDKLHPPAELRPDSGVAIPFEVRPRDGCPLRLGTYKIVASFDPSIARSPELAWIARFTPKSAEYTQVRGVARRPHRRGACHPLASRRALAPQHCQGMAERNQQAAPFRGILARGIREGSE
ncbi:MAG: hypothetical protein HYV63_10260 [Candidatus Schekmanbacteria bacterium]|nr:hypothetical protein [Candidatus Schekmanbacteria bacterium]